MLPDLTLPASWAAVLQNLRWVFTAPSFATFTALVTGLVANTGAGTVTGMLISSGLAQCWSHDRAHAFFSRAAWSSDTLGMYLSRLIVRTLLPDGAALTVAIDDTLFKKRGKKVFGAGWQHDGASRSEKPVGYGVCFVVAGIIVELPFCSRPFCLPVAVRLWRPKTAVFFGRFVVANVVGGALWPGCVPTTPMRSATPRRIGTYLLIGGIAAAASALVTMAVAVKRSMRRLESRAQAAFPGPAAVTVVASSIGTAAVP